MNIWVIGRSYPQESNNMKGSFELEQAKMLAKTGNKVSYLAVSFHPYKKIMKWGLCDWEEAGVHIFTASYFSTLERFRCYVIKYQEIKWREFLKEVEYKRGKPDVIHIHYPSMITIPNVILEYQKKGVKIIVTEHWSKVLTKKINSYECNQLTNYVNNADVFICVGNPLRNAVSDITKTKRNIEVVPNVVSNLFVPNVEKNKNEFKFIVIGRLVENKQFDKIITAFADTFKENKCVKLIVVGGGIEFKHLKQIINKYHMEEQIFMTGPLDRRGVAEQLKNADVLICYSKLETFGVTIIEAWACGIPAIASDSLGFLEYWNDDLGYVVPWNNIEALKTRMKDIHDNKERFNSSKIAKFAQNNFGEDAIIQRLIKYYEVVS